MFSKKILSIVSTLVLSFCLILSGCNNGNSTDNYLDNGIQKLNIDSQVSQIGISGSYFYYMSDITQKYNDDVCDYSFYKYNLLTGEKTIIGEIKKLSTWSETYAFLGCDKFFSTFSIIDCAKNINKHLMVDAISCKTETLSLDDQFPPLVYSVSVNENCFVEFQPQKSEDGSYKYYVRRGDKDGNMHNIIIKERKADYSGNMIVDICVYSDIIYTYEYENQKGYICSYDLNGNQFSKENVMLVEEFLNTPDKFTGDTETLSTIDVINGYYFFSTLNGKRLVLHKQQDNYSKVDSLIMNTMDSRSNLIQNVNPMGKEYKKIILYNYKTKELSCFNTDTGELMDLDFDLTDVAYAVTDGTQLVFQNNNQEFYYIKDVFRNEH